MVPYYSVTTDDAVTQAIDSGVARVFNSLLPNPLLNNPTIIKNIVFISNADTLVNHRLDRPVVGFIVINLNAAAIIYRSTTVNRIPTATIILKSNANVTADILFF